MFISFTPPHFLLLSSLLSPALSSPFLSPAQLPLLSPPSSSPDPFHSPSRLVSLARLATQSPSLSTAHLIALTHHLHAHPAKRLVRWASGQQEWVSEGEKALLILSERGRKFVDVTDWANDGFVLDTDADRLRLAAELAESTSNSFPTQLRFGSGLLAPLMDAVDPARMKVWLTDFSAFHTRYYHSRTGRQSQAWLLDVVRTLVSRSASNVSVSEFAHPWGQNTIIARFEPHASTSAGALAPTFIVGAHQDSTNLLPFLAAPGADDDGSGTTAVLEAFGVLLANDWTPGPGQGAVEFMWYSAEEGGLLGSQAVARAYRDAGRNVRGMVQMDMTAFVKQGTEPTVGLVTDFVDPALTQFLRLVIDEYLSIDWVNTKCGYACSDHASWTNINVPSAFAIESTFENSNHHIHSTGDTIDVPGFSFEHMAEFSKLVIGLVVELCGS